MDIITEWQDLNGDGHDITNGEQRRHGIKNKWYPWNSKKGSQRLQMCWSDDIHGIGFQ